MGSGTTTVRISKETHEKIAALAAEMEIPMSTVIDRAVREYRTKVFWDRVDEQVAWTQEHDPASWAEYVAETRLLDNAIADRLEPEDFSQYELPEKGSESEGEAR
jgi:predicted transcriptional regulator